jgi:hypothetical protein
MVNREDILNLKMLTSNKLEVLRNGFMLSDFLLFFKICADSVTVYVTAGIKETMKDSSLKDAYAL